MKKIVRLLLATLMVAGMFCLMGSNVAKAEEDMKVVYASVPADWEAPCVWAFDADGNSAFDAWPGGEMKADENNEGWYYIYIPSSTSNVIINANEGGVQTSDYSTNGENAWFTVTSPEEVAVTNEQQTEGDIPEYVPTFTVYAKVDESYGVPSVWAWSAPDGTNVFAAWPGEEMKENPDGFFSMDIPQWANSVIINGNAGTVQTADISVEPKDTWIVVDAENNFEVYDEKPEGDMITVHASVPEDWLLPCLWAWSAPDGTNAFANWPGEEFEQEGDWYVKKAPAWINSVIVNGTLGAVQTTDISVDVGKDIWVVVKSAEEYEVFYEEPELSAVTAEVSPAETTDTTEVAEAAEPAETADVAAPEESGMSTGIIILIVCAALAIVAVVVVIVKKNKKN